MTRFSVAAVFSVMVFAAPAFAQAPPPAAAVPPQQAPLRMAFLDLQRIAAESTEGKTASSKVQALTQKKSAELQDKQKALQATQQKLEQGGSVLNDSARAQLQADIERQQCDIQRATEDAQQEVTNLTQQLQAQFEERLRPIVDKVAKEKQVHFIFSAAESGLVWADPTMDLTVDVIKAFDASGGAAAKAPAAAPPAK